MALLPVDEALSRILAGVEAKPSETIAIGDAAHRVLAEPLRAQRTQPPFPASAMDGYAVRAADVLDAPVTLRVIGMAPAGAPFGGTVHAGETVRIFTGAPLPDGTDSVVIQENTKMAGEGAVLIETPLVAGRNVRRAGLDFIVGDTLLPAGRALDPAALSLAAAANNATLPVIGRPLVAIIATGDELVQPGNEPGPGQIIASNSYGVATLAADWGAAVLDLGIAADRKEDIAQLVRNAMEAGADVIVTLGGASVGDHDLVQAVLTSEGMTLDFWKIAMRPGKPLMFGRLGDSRVLGLPGNPVSSLVCAHLFLVPLVARLAGREHHRQPSAARLAEPMPANDLRQDYVRARIVDRGGYPPAITPLPIQDSSMLRSFAEADALIVRPPNAPAADAGEIVSILRLR